MSDSFLAAPGRVRRTAAILITAVAVVLAVVVVAAVLVFGRDGDGAEVAPPAPQPDATVNVPARPLTQLKGERTVEGISVGYPHTATGAICAAAEYTAQLGSTLDPDRARAIAKVIADPAYTYAGDKAVAGRLSSRRSLGVSEQGPVPPGVSMTVGPAAFQLRSVTEDSMTVLLLSYLTTADTNGTITPRVIVMPAHMRWAGGDWKLAAPGPGAEADFSALLAQPGTADAAAKGWQVITP